MKRRRGVFVTFEGVDGAGKSTLIRLVSRQIKKQKSLPVLITREPGGSALSEKIRRLIVGEGMHRMTELFLYEASRSEHVIQTIIPALEKGALVLCDRFTDSSLAYQSSARGIHWDVVRALNDYATHGLKPDITFLLDVPPAKSLKRAKNPNRFEAEGIKFQKEVRKGFLRARDENKNKWYTVIPREQTPAELAGTVSQIILNKLRAKGRR